MENVFNVPKKQWKKWSPLSRAVFNDVFEELNSNMSLYLHPVTSPLTATEQRTIAWNAAFVSAYAVKDNKVFPNV